MTDLQIVINALKHVIKLYKQTYDQADLLGDLQDIIDDYDEVLENGNS